MPLGSADTPFSGYLVKAGRFFAALCATGIIGALVGCGTATSVRLASAGDFVGLVKALDEEAAAGKLDESRVRDVSKAVLQHDLGHLAGSERIERLASCAKPMAGALRRLAGGNDEVAGTAALLLLETKLESVDSFTSRHRDSLVGTLRAAATRGLVDSSEATLRLTRSRDDDRYVRRAAVQAAGESGCASDIALLLEAARKDPDRLVRTEAIRGLADVAGHLDRDGLKADVVDRLGDLWGATDDALRGTIARTWASPHLASAGGRRRLEEAMGRVSGHLAVEVASSLLAVGGDGEVPLAKLAHDEESAVKIHALRVLDLDRPSHLEAVAKALAPAHDGEADDVSARELAAERLVAYVRPSRHALGKDFEKLRNEAIATLKKLVEREDRVGTDAAVALAELGDATGHARLSKDLTLPPTSVVRTRSAQALVRLGFSAEVRKLLADPNLDVRDAAACAVLAVGR